MTQVPPSTPQALTSLPPAPPGTPASLVRLFSLLLLVAGPLLAFWDPSGKLNSGVAQALVVIVFVLVAATIFVVREIIDGVHRYGWNMKALDYTWSQSQQQIDQDIVDFKNLWPQAQPLLQQLPVVNTTLTNVQTTVTALEQRVDTAAATAGMTPEQVVNAVESVTGIMLPRQAAPPPTPAPTPTP